MQRFPLQTPYEIHAMRALVVVMQRVQHNNSYPAYTYALLPIQRRS